MQGVSLMPGQGTKILHAIRHGQKKKKKETKTGRLFLHQMFHLIKKHQTAAACGQSLGLWCWMEQVLKLVSNLLTVTLRKSLHLSGPVSSAIFSACGVGAAGCGGCVSCTEQSPWCTAIVSKPHNFLVMGLVSGVWHKPATIPDPLQEPLLSG